MVVAAAVVGAEAEEGLAVALAEAPGLPVAEPALVGREGGTGVRAAGEGLVVVVEVEGAAVRAQIKMEAQGGEGQTLALLASGAIRG